MRNHKHLLALVILWAIIYLASCAYPPPLLDDADTVHAEAAREMVESGDWATLHANGVRYLEKAPLMYWGVATSYTLFGVSEWSTRDAAVIRPSSCFASWARRSICSRSSGRGGFTRNRAST